MFKVNTGLLDTTPASTSSVASAYPGASFTVSSDGTQNGIAWAVRTDQYTTHGPQVLYAWDANDLSNVLYESDANAPRDGGGKSMKFAIPVVTNGRVYIAANGQVDVYGLFNGAPIAGAPVFSPNGGNFGGTLDVTLSSATPSANIYYTLGWHDSHPGVDGVYGADHDHLQHNHSRDGEWGQFHSERGEQRFLYFARPNAVGEFRAGSGNLHHSADGQPVGYG